MTISQNPMCLCFRSSISYFRWFLSFFSGLTAVASSAQAQSFQSIPLLPNSNPAYSQANGLTADGSLAVGQSGNRAIAWSSSSSTIALPSFTGSTSSLARAINAGGSVAVGNSSISNTSIATIWYATSQGIQIGNLASSNVYSDAFAVSDNGSVAVGVIIPSVGNGAAIRWSINYSTLSVTTQALTSSVGTNNSTGVSADGSIVVGVSQGAAFRWSAASGTVLLNDLPGGLNDSGAQSISRDGRITVGFGTDATGRKPVAWTQFGSPVNLGTLPGSKFGIANAASFDGSIIVGKGTDSTGFVATIWDSIHGTRNLKSVLTTDFGLGSQLNG